LLAGTSLRDLVGCRARSRHCRRTRHLDRLPPSLRPGTKPVQLRADAAIIGTTTTAETHAAVLLSDVQHPHARQTSATRTSAELIGQRLSIAAAGFLPH